MKKELIQFFVGLLVLTACLFVQEPKISDTLVKVGIGYLLATLVALVVFLWEEWPRIWLIIQSNVFYRNKPVRVSMAYLFRIVVKGKFMLVRNHRDQPGYQPVGGVYKYLKAENEELFSKLGIVPCHSIPVDEQSENDLRKQILYRKNLISFLKWFDSKKNRETDPWREFYEELIGDGILKGDEFPYIQYNHCHAHQTRIQPSHKFPTDEFLHADIYELKWITRRQSEIFEKLMQVEDEQYVFVTPEEILNGYTAKGKVILAHTKKLLINNK